MDRTDVERRIEKLRASMEARRSRGQQEHRSGAIKFADAVTDLMAYIKREQRKAVPEKRHAERTGNTPRPE